MKKIFSITVMLLTIVTAFVFSPVSGAVSLAMLPAVAGAMNLHQLEELAKRNLSSFDGAPFEGNEFSNYIGDGDDLLDFGGGKNFATTHLEGRNFTMTIANTALTTQTCYLAPGISWYPGSTMAGAVKDGAFKSVANTDGLSGSGAPKTIAEFLAFVNKKSMQVTHMKIASNDVTQMSQVPVITPQSPFRNLTDRTFNIAAYQDQYVNQDKQIIFATPGLVLADDVQIALQIVPSSVCTITFFVGAVMNQSYTLENRINLATKTMESAPGGAEATTAHYKKLIGTGRTLNGNK